MIWSLLIQLLLVGYRNKSIQFLALGGLGLITSDVLYGLSQLNGGWEFGTPVDVTLSELALETFFPADPETAQWLREQAA